MPFASLQALAFPINVKGRRVSHSCGFVPLPDSPSNLRPALAHEAAPFASCYGLRIWRAPLAGYDPRLFSKSHRGALSRQVQPVCYHPGPPPAYTPKRATDVSTSFHVDRQRIRDLVHVSANLRGGLARPAAATHRLYSRQGRARSPCQVHAAVRRLVDYFVASGTISTTSTRAFSVLSFFHQ
jgi:hypothetical protein